MRALLISLVLTGILVYTIVDIIVIDESRVRHLPKPFWIILAILVPIIGPLLWFLIGRERLERRDGGRYRSEPTSAPPRPRALGPDDDPEFLERLARDREREQRIRELEAKLRELDDDKPKD